MITSALRDAVGENVEVMTVLGFHHSFFTLSQIGLFIARLLIIFHMVLHVYAALYLLRVCLVEDDDNGCVKSFQ